MLDNFDLNFYIDEMSWFSVLDIVLVAFVIFGLLWFVRGTRAVQLLRGILVVAFVLFFVNLFEPLTALGWLVASILPALFISIPIIFQPELRRAFTRVGEAGKLSTFLPVRRNQKNNPLVGTLADACRRLSTRRHGALIVIERDTGLQEYIDTGVQIDALVSTPLLLNIFHKDVDLHDGGVIIRNQRIAAASCVMPLSNTRMSDRQMGLRHRAALGTSEVSDAVILVVSEETGHIAIAHNGRVLPKQPQQNLESVLQGFLQKAGT